MADIEFQQMLIKLSAKLRAINQNFDKLTRHSLERELNTADSFMSLLWDKIKRENIDLLRFELQILEVEQSLANLKLKLESRSQDPFWLRLFGFLERAINFLASLFGLQPLLDFSKLKLLRYDKD